MTKMVLMGRNLLSSGAGVLRVVARFGGVYRTTTEGLPVKARKARLTALVSVLCALVLNWLGVDSEVIQAVADAVLLFGSTSL